MKGVVNRETECGPHCYQADSNGLFDESPSTWQAVANGKVAPEWIWQLPLVF
jgi:hypothetical protein